MSKVAAPVRLAEGVLSLVGDMPSAEFAALGLVGERRLYALCDLARITLQQAGRAEFLAAPAGEWDNPEWQRVHNG